MGDMPSLMPCEGLKIVAHSSLFKFVAHISEKGCCVKLVRHAGTGEQNSTFTFNTDYAHIDLQIFLQFVSYATNYLYLVKCQYLKRKCFSSKF